MDDLLQQVSLELNDNYLYVFFTPLTKDSMIWFN